MSAPDQLPELEACSEVGMADGLLRREAEGVANDLDLDQGTDIAVLVICGSTLQDLSPGGHQIPGARPINELDARLRGFENPS